MNQNPATGFSTDGQNEPLDSRRNKQLNKEETNSSLPRNNRLDAIRIKRLDSLLLLEFCPLFTTTFSRISFHCNWRLVMDGKQKVPFSNLFALLFLGNAWEWIFDKINCHTIGILQKKKKKKQAESE